MRNVPIAVLAVLLALLASSSASALDICEEGCQPPDAEQNTPYEFEFEAEEGCVPYRFSYLNGTVPPGLRITEDGKLTGTPTEAGTFQFWVGLDDSVDCKSPQSQGHYFITVLPDLAVTTESLPPAVPGRPYSAQLRFSNPEVGWPVVWDITQGAMPTGVTLSESGVISGTTTGPDTKTFVVRAREPFRRFGEKELTLTVAAALQARSAVRAGEVGLRYRGSVPATGGLPPLTWSVASGALPAGLSLNTSTGAISGVPRTAGLFALTFAVSDSAGQRASVPAGIRIAARLTIATARLPLTTVGEEYLARLASIGGLAPTQWRIVKGPLPRGISLDRKTGVLSGVARKAGRYRITVRATDRLGGFSTRTLTLVVQS